MRIMKIASDFMDSAMNNKRLNMGELVGEAMEPILIQILDWYIKPFNLTYWGCLYLKRWRNYKMHWKFAFFAILKNFKGGTLGKKIFSKFSQSFYFLLGEHMSLLEWNRRISECIKTKDSLNVTHSWWWAVGTQWNSVFFTGGDRKIINL